MAYFAKYPYLLYYPTNDVNLREEWYVAKQYTKSCISAHRATDRLKNYMFR